MIKRKILIAERDKSALAELQRAVKSLGYSSVTATSGTESIRKAADTHPDAAIIAMRLSGTVSGVRAAAAIRERSDVPIIMLTSSLSSAELAKMKTAGASNVLKAPFSADELRTSIELTISSHESEHTRLRPGEESLAILEHMGDGLIVTDRQSHITVMNPAAERLTGWSTADAMGRKLSDVFRIVDEDHRKPVHITIAKIVKEGATRQMAGSAILTHKSGRDVHIDDCATAIRNEHGKITGLILVFRDITEQQAVARRAIQQQKIEAIGTLAASVAHDFNNVLHVITGHASSMADSLISETRAHEDALRIVETAKSSHQIISRLISVARASQIETGDTSETVSVGEVVRDAEKLFHATFSELNVTLEIMGIDHQHYVKATATGLLDAMICLFANAADASPDGGTVTVTAVRREMSKPNTRLNPNAKPGPYIAIRIADTGCGMERSVANQVFDPFFSTKDDLHAKGLGLTLVQHAVHSWGGWITVSSKVSEGTRFILHVPEAKVKKSATRRVKTGGELVLVVDDKKDDIEIINRILTDGGYRVIAAGSPKEALALYETHKDSVTVAIIDLILGDEYGNDVFHGIRTRDPEAGIVMISGFSRDYIRSRLGVGGWGFAQKPIEKDHLLTTVERIVTQKAEAAADMSSLSD